MEDDVYVFEEAGADHVDLAGAAFLGGCAVVAEGAGRVVLGHEVLDGNGGEGGTGAEEIVSAAVAGSSADDGFAGGDGLLGETGEGVEFAQNCDDGLAGAVGGDEAGGFVGYSTLDGEAGFFELVLEEGGAFILVVAEFGEAPDVFGDLFVLGGVGVY